MQKAKYYRLATFTAVAKANGLPNALGRACYAVNRQLNGGLHYGNCGKGTGNYTPCAQPCTACTARLLHVLQACKPATAKRHLANYRKGNSLKSLTHGTAGRNRYAHTVYSNSTTAQRQAIRQNTGLTASLMQQGYTGSN